MHRKRKATTVAMANTFQSLKYRPPKIMLLRIMVKGVRVHTIIA